MNQLLTVIKIFLGKEKFAEKDGKAHLTDDELAKVKSMFGEETAKIVTDALANGNNSDAEGNSEMAKLIAALADQSQKQTADFQKKINALADDKDKLKALIDELAGKEEEDPEPEMGKNLARDTAKPTIMKVSGKNPVYAAAYEFLETGRSSVSAANENGDTIDVSELKAEFGTYLNTQRNLDILRRILTGFTTAKYMTTKMALTEWRATQAIITSVVQQFSPKWTPNGKVKFRPLVIKNRRQKINFPIVPADVLDSYLLYLYDEGLHPDQMPITTYIMNVMVFPQALQDIELRMVAKGRYEELDWSGVSDGDAGTPPEDGCDGFETILVDSKPLRGTANDTFINYFRPAVTFNWVTATDQEVLDFINAFVDWINPQYQTMMAPVFCSLDVYKRYKRAYKKIWGTGSGQDGDFGKDKIDYSNNVLIPLDSMYRSPIIFSTPKENFIKLRHKNEVPNVINDVQRFNYLVKLFGEFWFGVGFALGEAVFAYVPDGYDPKASIKGAWGDFDDYQGYIGESDGSSGGGL